MDKGTLNEDDLKKIRTWIKEKWKTGTCTVCGVNDWLVGSDLIVTPIIMKDQIQLAGRAYIHVLVSCNECGHMVFFNAKKIGLGQDSEESKDGG